jgi:hypothetical protein
LGVKGPEQIELVTQSIVGRKGEFEALVEKIREDIGRG